jgi:hypothetical protein
MNIHRLKKDIEELSYVYPVALDDDLKSLRVGDFNLPLGYNYDSISILLRIPKQYPEEPPGVGDARVFVPNNLRYKGRKPKDFHDDCGPKGWAWWCYLWIDWDPCRDNLITFFELLRAHLTNPK